MNAFIKGTGCFLVLCVNFALYTMDPLPKKTLATKEIKGSWIRRTKAQEIPYNPDDPKDKISAYILQLRKRCPNLRAFLEANSNNILLVSPQTTRSIDHSITHLEQSRCNIL